MVHDSVTGEPASWRTESAFQRERDSVSGLMAPSDEFDLDSHPWAWASFEEGGEQFADLSQIRVTAVLVTLDAARWLPETLAGLSQLRHRPHRFLAIDNGSTDATRELLDEALGQGLFDAVYQGRPGDGFGAGVRSALKQDKGQAPGDRHGVNPTDDTGGGPEPSDTDPAPEEWLWLLHDDAVPAPDALDRLVLHVTNDARIDVTGPKLLHPLRRQNAYQLSEIGVTISGTGRRELLLEPGEIDQGQRDQPVERLGVSTCGMFVRRSVWEELGGLDPALPIFRDGVDFGWRAQLRGHHVVTSPRSVFIHRQVGRAALRPRGAAGRNPGKVDRQLGMLVVLGHVPPGRLALSWLRLLWSSVLHAIGYLLGKLPGRAWDELRALGAFVADPGSIRALRRRRAALTPVSGARDHVKMLRPPWWSSLHLAGEAVSSAVGERYRSVAGDGEVASLDELTADDLGSTVAEENPPNPWFSPIFITGVLSVVVSLVAARGLFGNGSLAAPALLPAPERLAALWATATAPIPGAPGQISPPWLGLTALGSTVLAGRPEWLVTVLLLGIVPLSLASSYPLLRLVISDRRVRVWVAFTYALLPVLLGGTNQGRLALSIFAIAVPWLAHAVRGIALRRTHTAEAWRGGWGAGLMLVVLVAFEPSIMALALLLGAIGMVVLRRTRRKVGRVAIALIVPLVVLAPWWPSLILAWGRLVTGPDAALTRAGIAGPNPWQLMLGQGLGPGLPPLWLSGMVFVVVWLVALAGLARRPQARPVVAAWVTALLAVTAAVLLSRLVVLVPPLGTETRPWVGTYLLICFAALLLAGGIGVDGLAAQMKHRSFSLMQPATALITVVVGLVSVAGAAWWALDGAGGPIERRNLDGIPPYVQNAMLSESRVRVLAVDLTDDAARFSVVYDDQVRLGDADRGFAFGGSAAASAEAADLVIRMVAGTADDDISSQLAELGVGYVWVAGATEEDRARIANTPGIEVASGSEVGTVWQVQPPVTRAALVIGSVRTPVLSRSVDVGPGAPGRELHTGEPVDPRWRATLDGAPLTAVPGGWQQVFAVPAEGGRLTYELQSTISWLFWAQGAALLVVAVLAAPGIRTPEVRDPTKVARRAATARGSF